MPQGFDVNLWQQASVVLVLVVVLWSGHKGYWYWSPGVHAWTTELARERDDWRLLAVTLLRKQGIDVPVAFEASRGVRLPESERAVFMILDYGPGVHLLTDPITVAGDALTIRGVPGQTELRWTQPGGGIQVTSVGSAMGSLAIEGCILSTSVVDGAAITVQNGQTGIHTVERTVRVRDVTIRPETGYGGGYFTTGIRLVDVWDALLADVVIHGPTATWPVAGTTGIVLDGWSVGTIIRGAVLSHLDIGIDMHGNSEGIALSQSAASFVRVGFLQNSVRAVGAPVGFISDFHAAALSRGIFILKGVDAMITSPLIYRHPWGTGEFVAIQFYGTASYRNQVIGGSLADAGSGGLSYGIATNMPYTRIVGVGMEAFDVPYDLQPGSVGSVVVGTIAYG